MLKSTLQFLVCSLLPLHVHTWFQNQTVFPLVETQLGVRAICEPKWDCLYYDKALWERRLCLKQICFISQLNVKWELAFLTPLLIPSGMDSSHSRLRQLETYILSSTGVDKILYRCSPLPQDKLSLLQPLMLNCPGSNSTFPKVFQISGQNT